MNASLRAHGQASMKVPLLLQQSIANLVQSDGLCLIRTSSPGSCPSSLSSSSCQQILARKNALRVDKESYATWRFYWIAIAMECFWFSRRCCRNFPTKLVIPTLPHLRFLICHPFCFYLHSPPNFQKPLPKALSSPREALCFTSTVFSLKIFF